jgi:hypothetical protein
VVGIICWAATACRVAAIAPEIKDDGKFFSAEAIKKGNEQIREIMRKYDTDLLIETYSAAPADQIDKLKKQSSQERSKFFHTWAVDRSNAVVVKGVYILICKDPPHLQIEISPKMRSAFDNRARDHLVELLLAELQKKRYDQALESAINYVNEKLAGPVPAKQ